MLSEMLASSANSFCWNHLSVIPHTSLSHSRVSNVPSNLQYSDSLLSLAMNSATVFPSFCTRVLKLNFCTISDGGG